MGLSIAVDRAGAAYVTGQNASDDFPTVHPLQPTYGGGFQDAFVTKIAPSGSQLVYSSHLGGRQGDRGYGIAVDAGGHAYVFGETGRRTSRPRRAPWTRCVGPTVAVMAAVTSSSPRCMPRGIPWSTQPISEGAGRSGREAAMGLPWARTQRLRHGLDPVGRFSHDTRTAAQRGLRRRGDTTQPRGDGVALRRIPTPPPPSPPPAGLAVIAVRRLLSPSCTTRTSRAPRAAPSRRPQKSIPAPTPVRS